MTNVYKNASEALPDLFNQVLKYGDRVESRNGVTMELAMQHIKLSDPTAQKEITALGRRVSLPAQIAETMWILAGRNDVEWLSYYLPRAAEFADDGQHWRGGYGPRLRGFADKVDQLAHIVRLLGQDPETRRAVFNIYDPLIDTEPGKDIPCNNWVHFLPRGGVLHAHVAIRSNDLFWGWSGINAFEWTALLQVVAGLTGMECGSVTFAISSLHLYEHHWKRAGEIVENARQNMHHGDRFYQAPRFKFHGTLEEFDALVEKWFRIEGQIRKGGLSSAVLHQVASFPEPMLRSWLFVLLAWTHDDLGLMQEFRKTALYVATERSPKRKPLPKVPLTNTESGFTTFVKNLHAEKNAAYGNSWMKRGEMLGIMANCARKVDRLGVGGAGDTAADTAIDLLVYFIKYDLWLEQQKHSDWHLTEGDSHVAAVADYLEKLAAEKHSTTASDALISGIKVRFDHLEQAVTEKRYDRDILVKMLIEATYPLALRLWSKEQNAEGAAMDAFMSSQAERDAIEASQSHSDRNSTRRFDGYSEGHK